MKRSTECPFGPECVTTLEWGYIDDPNNENVAAVLRVEQLPNDSPHKDDPRYVNLAAGFFEILLVCCVKHAVWTTFRGGDRLEDVVQVPVKTCADGLIRGVDYDG